MLALNRIRYNTRSACKQAEIEVVTSRFLKPDLVRASGGKWQVTITF